MRSATTCLLVLGALAAAALKTLPAMGFAQGPTPGWAVATLRVGVARGNGYSVTIVPLDPYVARVLAGEASPDSQPAALEALAIAVRTYALANLRRHR